MTEEEKKPNKDSEKKELEQIKPQVPTVSTEGPKHFPPEAQQQLQQITSEFSMFAGTMPHPLAGKINEGHITTWLDLTDRQDKRQWWFKLAFYISSLLSLLFIIYLLKEDKDLLYPIITLVMGFLGGWGFGRAAKLGN